MKKVMFLASIVAIALNGCIFSQPEYHDYTYPENYDETMYGATQNSVNLRHSNIPSSRNYESSYTREQAAPRASHFSKKISPRRHKEHDVEWVQSQPESNYTIEVGSGQNAASVARKLHSSPKSIRRAQVKLGSGEYTGLVGSYQTREEAEKALSNLPEDVRKNASVNQWNKIKGKLATSSPENVLHDTAADNLDLDND